MLNGLCVVLHVFVLRAHQGSAGVEDKEALEVTAVIRESADFVPSCR
jgi:hypothetical protein